MNRRKHENQARTISAKDGNSIKEIDSIKQTNSIKKYDENSPCEDCSETYSNSKVYWNSVDKILSNYKNDIETIKNNKTLYRIEDCPVEDIKNSTKDSMKNPRKINQTIICVCCRSIYSNFIFYIIHFSIYLTWNKIITS